ncbi:MAG: hypothetical protein RR671_00205 [Raoultibacter sp.]
MILVKEGWDIVYNGTGKPTVGDRLSMIVKSDRPTPIGDDGLPMTKWQVRLKWLCMIMIVWAVVDLLIGIAMIAFSYLVNEGFSGLLGMGVDDVRSLFLILGVASIVGAFVNVVLGFLGTRGAKNPQKIALFFWIALIDAVLTAWSAVSAASQGVADFAAIVSGAFIFALAVCAWQVRGQTGYFDNHPVPEDDEGEVGKDFSLNQNRRA